MISDSDVDTYVTTDAGVNYPNQIRMYAGGKEVARFDSSGLLMMKMHKRYKSYPVSDFEPTDVVYDYDSTYRCDGFGASVYYEKPSKSYIKDNLYRYLNDGPLLANTDLMTALDLPHGARLDSLGITIKADYYSLRVCFKLLKTNIRTGQKEYIEMSDAYIFPNSLGILTKSVGYNEIIDNQHYYYSIIVRIPFNPIDKVYLVGAYVQYTTTDMFNY